MLSSKPIKKWPAQPLAITATFWNDQIDGCYRRLTVMQLALVWWLYREHHLSGRQFRIYFALHEMDERRRGVKSHRSPSYGPEELRRLIGARDEASLSDSLLIADVGHLQSLGLLTFNSNALRFATSPDAVCLEDLSGFWSYFAEFSNTRRVLPVPRRVVRALAGGMTRVVAGCMIAMLIRCLYGHGNEKRAYRVDGRVKASWIATTFGLSLRSVRTARATLIELGIITELPVTQHELNRWGGRYQLNLDWQAGTKAVGEGDHATLPDVETNPSSDKIAPPNPENAAEFAPPYKDQQFSSTRELKNSSPARLGPTVVSIEKVREEKSRAKMPARLHDMTPEDFRDFYRLRDLYDQACSKNLARQSEHGQLQFFSLAERAKAHGKSPHRLFAWMLKRQRFDLITDSDEDRAHAWIKAMRYGIKKRHAPDPYTVDQQQREETYAQMREAGMM